MPVIVTLDALDKEALIRILTEPKNALIKQYQRLLKMDHVELEFTEESLDAIAEAALVRKTGARGLRSIVEKTMNDIMYEVPSNPQIAKVIIHKECITEDKAPEIVLHKNKKQQPTKTAIKRSCLTGDNSFFSAFLRKTDML